MTLPKEYLPGEAEYKMQALWDKGKPYQFNPNDGRHVYSIDMFPRTVSGNLHSGHTYSYTHADVFARFHRLRGENVFYPMGYDDNELPQRAIPILQSGKINAYLVP